MRLTVKQVRTLLDYDPITGELRWRMREVKTKYDKIFNTQHAGMIAGYLDPSHRYIVVVINHKLYKGHILAWAHYYGSWPENEIDHRNGIRSGNWIKNLREATHLQNAQNRKKMNGSSKFMGVSFCKKVNRFQAQIMINYKKIWLGYHDTEEQASFAYLEAKTKYHTFQPIPRNNTHGTP